MTPATLQPRSPAVPALSILGVLVDIVDFQTAMQRIEHFMALEGAHQIVTINPEFVMTAQTDPEFRAILNQADLSVPDGVGILWAARRQGVSLPDRVGGIELIHLIAARAAQTGWRLFLLGAAPGVAEKAALRLIAQYPGLRVAGTYAGSPDPQDEDGIVGRIQAARADILFVAYGAPRQDQWLARNLARTGARLGMGVGGALDYLAGIRPRAPLWVRRLWLDWLFRLLTQPWRWRRMLALPRFAWAVLRDKVTRSK